MSSSAYLTISKICSVSSSFFCSFTIIHTLHGVLPPKRGGFFCLRGFNLTWRTLVVVVVVVVVGVGYMRELRGGVIWSLVVSIYLEDNRSVVNMKYSLMTYNFKVKLRHFLKHDNCIVPLSLSLTSPIILTTLKNFKSITYSHTKIWL